MFVCVWKWFSLWPFIWLCAVWVCVARRCVFPAKKEITINAWVSGEFMQTFYILHTPRTAGMTVRERLLSFDIVVRLFCFCVCLLVCVWLSFNFIHFSMHLWGLTIILFALNSTLHFIELVYVIYYFFLHSMHYL